MGGISEAVGVLLVFFGMLVGFGGCVAEMNERPNAVGVCGWVAAVVGSVLYAGSQLSRDVRWLRSSDRSNPAAEARGPGADRTAD
jgi:membrane associated rhomboid family serine protease